MAEDEHYSLCWNNFNSNLSAGFHESLCRGDLVDVTLAAEGQLVKAHRLVLSACSPFFRKMFTQMPVNQYAFVFLKDVSHSALKDLIQFIYCGEVNVKQEALPAFISTAEALQIKGLTDSEPPPSQTPPAVPSTPMPQAQIQTSPRVRQRTSTIGRNYKIESVDDSGDDSKQQTTQIVIQTTAPPHQTGYNLHATAPTAVATTAAPSHHITQQPIQTQTHQITSVNIPTSTTAAVVTHKRPAPRISLGNVSHIKRSKTNDPLDVADTAVVPQQNEQTTVVTEIKPQAQQHHHQAQQQHHHQQPQQATETEYIDLPIELPTKSNADYTQEPVDVDQGEQDGTYVEDEAYADMRYDESYFTEGEDVGVTGPAADTSPTATTSKAIVKQQPITESFMDTSADPGNSDAQEQVKFIRSQKKNAQLVYKGFIYNKKLTQANGHTTWRCVDVLKMRCKAVVITKQNELVTARRDHNHEDHLQRISQRPLYSEEEDLGDYIEIKPDSATLNEYISMGNVDILPQKSGKEYKLFVPASCTDIKSRILKRADM